MPFKHNASRRHRIGKMKFKVTNWAEYEAGLRRRGSLTLWMTPEALSSWQAPKRTTRGGQPRSSDLAIETALTLGRRASKRRLPNKRQDDRDRIPEKGAVHVLVDSPGLQIYARASGWRKSMALNYVETGANCTWRWMPTAARSSLTS